jgi:hypothetical protein
MGLMLLDDAASYRHHLLKDKIAQAERTGRGIICQRRSIFFVFLLEWQENHYCIVQLCDLKLHNGVG